MSWPKFRTEMISIDFRYFPCPHCSGVWMRKVFDSFGLAHRKTYRIESIDQFHSIANEWFRLSFFFIKFNDHRRHGYSILWEPKTKLPDPFDIKMFLFFFCFLTLRFFHISLSTYRSEWRARDWFSEPFLNISCVWCQTKKWNETKRTNFHPRDVNRNE